MCKLNYALIMSQTVCSELNKLGREFNANSRPTQANKPRLNAVKMKRLNRLAKIANSALRLQYSR